MCGASAAMALATTLGERRASQAQLALVLVGISAASATAMFFYPLIAHVVSGMSDRQAEFMLGASIHDVAQALGAGYSFSDPAGQTAAIVKLTRVALLAPVLALVAAVFRPEDGGGKAPPIPWFVAGFFVLAGVNSSASSAIASEGTRRPAPPASPAPSPRRASARRCARCSTPARAR
ncbi:putative sulfate exporter family transporter [Sphingomonas sp. MMS24-JH45]